MTAILPNNLANIVARSFISQMAGANNFLYMFEGQNLPWPDDSLPPTPTDAIISFKTIWDNMLAAKLITVNNLSLVVENNTWSTGTIYQAYTDQFTNAGNFYVITSNNEVYKCLSNNNGGAASIQPIGTGTSSNNYTQTSNDGYIWKYMLNVQVNDPFFNNFWIPIPEIAPVGSLQATIENSAVPGSIDIINVTSGGSNYVNGGQQYIINITGDGVNANAYANVVGGVVQNIVPINRGLGYSFANITFNDPQGNGAKAAAVMPPPNGHGSDASTELGATTVMISISVTGSESGYFTTSNQFRQNGLLLNPLQFSSNTISSNALIKTAQTINVTGGIGTYNTNETVFQGTSINSSTFSGSVIDFDPILGILRLNNIIGIAAIGSILYGLSSGAQRYITNIIFPDVQRYTGKILSIDNEVPIQRNTLETDQFQFAISF